ncbi:MAG: UDP-3-O-(3-hydroxymyristoyl)glucosamine N-acyltransferase [Terracidiphilus sp.]|nr:UDP-3-O-(3-hydroxymyristoyl)glucosamine N-acyltransferase [Terracidiphilus sp.]
MILKELVDKLGGTLVQGDPEWLVESVSACDEAGTFDLVFADTAPSAVQALAGGAGVVVLKPGAALSYPHGKCIVESGNPRLWFSRAAKLITPRPFSSGVHARAIVSPDIVVGGSVSIGPGAIIESGVHIGEGSRIEAGAIICHDVRIGVDCRIYPSAVIYPGTTLGDRVTIHAGAVLGADGFGYVRDPASGTYVQFPQQGKLIVEDDVEIGANTTIDRGALHETRIRRGAKIDNLVHVGHNCDIGEDVILVALTGISGSSSVGKGAVIAGQVGIGDHVHIGPGVILGGQAGVLTGKTLTADGVPPGTVFWGTPARPLKQILREQATLARLTKRLSRDRSGKA